MPAYHLCCLCSNGLMALPWRPLAETAAVSCELRRLTKITPFIRTQPGNGPHCRCRSPEDSRLRRPSLLRLRHRSRNYLRTRAFVQCLRGITHFPPTMRQHTFSSWNGVRSAPHANVIFNGLIPIADKLGASCSLSLLCSRRTSRLPC